ncbi:uncharacterized protein [Dysidea avara]|uniref:uncharacterized protein isoform X4 n=1 Tax=Dysidea avara TaxID=196820 RepID=UPI0033171A62
MHLLNVIVIVLFQTNEALQKAFDVKMRITTAYHPQSNGLDERTNQTLKRSMSKLMEDYSDNWGKYLDSAIFATNSSVQASTKHTPFLLMYGREARFPLEAEKEAESTVLDGAINNFCKADFEQYIKECFEKQKSIFSKTDVAIKAAQVKQKQQYAQRKGIVEYGFKIGDKVLRRNMQQKTKKGKKMEDRWLGPYIIVEITKTSCLLKNKSDKILKQRINICQLKPYLDIPCQNGDNNATGNTNRFLKSNLPEEDMPVDKDHASIRSDQEISNQSSVRSDQPSERSDQPSVRSDQPSVGSDQGISDQPLLHDGSVESHHAFHIDEQPRFQGDDGNKLEPCLAGTSAFNGSISNKLLADEVDASSTPVSAGGYFPTFHQDQGQMSPIAMTTKKTMVDEVLASPQGIAKCKRLLKFSVNSSDDQNVRKVRKRKLILPHLQPDGNSKKKSKSDVNGKVKPDVVKVEKSKTTSKVKAAIQKTDQKTTRPSSNLTLITNKESSEPHKQLEHIWKGQPCHVIKARINRFSIHHGSFHTLKQNCYLNDEIINGYLRLLADIHGNCFVIPSQTLTTIINRSAVCHRSYLLSRESLHQKKYLVGCYNQDSNHWIFIAIDLESKHFYYLDPFGPSRALRGTFAALNIDKFKVHEVSKKIQFDPFNCGVFSLKIAEQLLLSGTIDEDNLSSMDIMQARIDIAITILSHSVDMKERCVMCGASDISLSHPDYCDWIKCDHCKCWTHTHYANTTIAEAKKSTFLCLECYQTKHNIEHFVH